MRWKFERDNFEAYKCCFCLHVRTGTLLLGLLHLVEYVTLISLFIAALLHPDWIQAYVPGLLEPVSGFSLGFTNASNDSQTTWLYTRDLISDNLLISLLLTVGSLSITVCLIYGTLMGRPQFITPFFCIQVFELCIAGMMMLSYFSDIPDLKKWIASREKIPFRDAILKMDNDHLTLITLIVFVVVLSVKMYLIGIVWACYKYLKQHEGVARQARIRVYDRETDNPEDTEMLLPPKYEDVLRMPNPEAAAPPPAYTAQ